MMFDRKNLFAYRHQHAASVVIAFLCVLVLVTCGKDSPTKPQPPPTPPAPPPPVTPVPTRIMIIPAGQTLNAIGQTVQLSASVFDQNGSPMTSAVSWESSDAAVASVSATGLVTAVANGATTITAKAGAATQSARITVSQTVARIAIMPESSTLVSIGQTVQLTAAILDQNGNPVTGASVNWISDNVLIARVNDTGLVTALMNGKAMILAVSNNVTARASITVMQAAVRIVIMPESPALDALGQTLQLMATVFDGNGSPVPDAPVNWTSGDPAVASVSTTGQVTARMNGTAEITAASGDATARTIVTVFQIPVRIEVAPESAVLTAVGEAVQLAATVLDRNGFSVPGGTFTWTSSDPDVAEVGSMGQVTAWLNGSTQITSESDELSGTTQIEVRITSPHFESLVAMYNFTLGPGWVNSENWLSEVLVDDWHGVTADRVSQVVELDLSYNNLRHTLPAEVADIGSLRKLVLTGNAYLSGPVPKAITRLDLDVLYLDGTNMCIPPDTAFQDWLSRIPDVNATTCASNRRDWDALVALHNQTNGSNWKTNYNWLSNAPLDSWYGVEADANGRVRRIVLNENNLEGELPSEIGQLEGLEWLALNENQLSGSLPLEITELNKLWYLSLNSNNLSGSIPPEIGRNESLAVLYLGFNELTGSIPAELGRLDRLRTLSFDTNHLTGTIPPEIGQLTGMDLMYFSNNNLSGSIPPELGRLTRARSIWLDNNQLTGSIPPELGQLETIGVVNLTGNRLSGSIPAEIARASNMRWFLVAENPDLDGPLPRTFLDLNLDGLKLQGTRICIPADDEFVVWLGGIQDSDATFCGDQVREALIALYNGTDGPNWVTGENWLTDMPLEAWYGIVVNGQGLVTVLNLADNNLNGTLKPSLGILSDLKRLNLKGNPGLYGPLPRSILEIDLDVLDLEGTDLCIPMDREFQRWLQEIPESYTDNCVDYHPDREALVALYNATGGPNWIRSLNWVSDAPLHEWHGVKTGTGGQVTEISLSDNRMTGPIPVELGQLSGLRRLSIFNNHLSGSIPGEIGQLEQLRYLSFHNNDLTGSIPPEIGRLTNLEQLSLSSNRLTGNIPPELGQMENLMRLSFDNNHLRGSIPPELGQLKNLEYLSFRVNRLTGSIPPEIGKMSSLNSLNLFQNSLSGPIPHELGNLSNLGSLYLWRNQLTGAIPAELGRLRNLTVLQLSTNKLSGPIPPELGNLSNLGGLHLLGNQLSGSIPPELGRLGRLTILEMNTNNLSGAVPAELGSLASLKKMNFARNSGLSGPLPLTFIKLNLDELVVERTGLCAPLDPVFQEWMRLQPFDPIPNCTPTTGTP